MVNFHVKGHKLVFETFNKWGALNTTGLMTHLYLYDSEVRHRGVVEENAGVGGVLHTREDLGGGGGGAIVQHLAQRVDVDVLRRETSTHRVVRARHAFYTVCTPGTQRHMYMCVWV